MRKLIVSLVAALTLAVMPVAGAHPSENRADQSTFDGPHCHTNEMSQNFAFPSHRAHLATLDAGLSVFTGVACP
jgi:hypothetical protein